MFRLLMDNSLYMVMYLIIYSHIVLIMMNVCSISYCYVLESIELINQIHSHIFCIPDDIIDDNPLDITTENDLETIDKKEWSSIVIRKDLFQSFTAELLLANYSHVQYIYLQDNTFGKASAVKVTNLPELRVFQVNEDACQTTNSLLFESYYYMNE